MLKEITIFDDEEFLRQVSKPVDFENDNDLEQNLNDLIEYTLNNNKAYAMASVQLGIPKRILFVKSTKEGCASTGEDNSLILMINPVVLSRKGKTEFWEACISGSNYIGLVERPYELVIKYQDRNGEEKTEKFEGFASTVLSHELDHLDGIFHMDRAKELHWVPKEERKTFRSDEPYKIISKTCQFNYPEVSLKKYSEEVENY